MNCMTALPALSNILWIAVYKEAQGIQSSDSLLRKLHWKYINDKCQYNLAKSDINRPSSPVFSFQLCQLTILKSNLCV